MKMPGVFKAQNVRLLATGELGTIPPGCTARSCMPLENSVDGENKPTFSPRARIASSARHVRFIR